jgi:uncharacterized protein YidB (DUF937 family)
MLIDPNTIIIRHAPTPASNGPSTHNVRLHAESKVLRGVRKEARNVAALTKRIGTDVAAASFAFDQHRRSDMSRGYPSMTALLGLLAIAGYQNRDKIAEMLGGGQNRDGQNPSGQQQGGLGGLLGSLGGAGGGGGLGGLLGGLGGAGAGGLLGGGLGELIENFREKGQGDVADSWVGTGPNKDIEPQQLEQAIGPDVLDTLAQQTGLSREEIVARLSKELPNAVDQYTPDGRLPS